MGLSPLAKLSLGLRIWWSFVRIHVSLRRRPLPEVVQQLGRAGRERGPELAPRRLGLVVQRALSVRNHEPRCLISSLVLFDLLKRVGIEPTLVIGLPGSPSSKDAHAWIEIDGVDVGPPPGRGTHRELARYGA